MQIAEVLSAVKERSNMKTLLKFSADYCTPCKQLSKTLDGLTLEGINLQEIDIEGNLDLVKQWTIRSVPTLILLDEDAKELKRHTGGLSAVALMQFIGDPTMVEPWKETW